MQKRQFAKNDRKATGWCQQKTFEIGGVNMEFNRFLITLRHQIYKLIPDISAFHVVHRLMIYIRIKFEEK
jgi:hypothetical protein